MDAANRHELSPLSFLRRSAAVFRDRTAVVHGDRRLSYGELGERAARLARALRGAGVADGDRVAFLSPNTPALLEAHFGVPAAGGVLVALNTRLAPPEIAYVLDHSGARVLVVDRELAHLAAEGPAGLEVVPLEDTGGPDDPYERFLASGGGAEAPRSAPPSEDELISLNYTSGTTGSPKGVMYTHRGAYLNALAQVVEMGLSERTVYLWVLPMFHCNGWCYPWAVTAVGGTHVCLRKVDPPRIWELLESEGVTNLCCAPTVATALVHDPAARRLDRPVTIAMGGAPPSPALIERMAELDLHPVHLYGLTETYGPSTLCTWREAWDVLPLEERARLRARQGVGHSLVGGHRVVDERLADVPADGATMGEIVVRGSTVCAGYFRDPEGTARAFEGGWFHTGDLAVLHPDGYAEIRDRAKDVIVSGGENISTIEVEQAIAKHPAVLECAVVAAPDPRWGERPKAFVTLKADADASEREIVDFCRSRIAHYKCPDRVEFGDLPKTSTGKIQKYVLREREWAGHDRRVGSA